MRAALLTISLAFALAAAPIAQSRKAPKTLTLTGCVERDETAPDQYTVTDSKAGTKYRITGKDFREFLGQRVQLDGGIVVKGIKISGGLQPNPNVAAQAGALDPSRAMVQAATSGSAKGAAADVQEFKVDTIRTTAGSCK